MAKTIKVQDLIERLNNFDFKRGTKIKFLDKVYLYDYPNLVGIYEIGKPTKKEYSIFAQFDITNLHNEAEIIEEQQDIDIQEYEFPAYADAKLNPIERKLLELINETRQAVKQLDRQIKDKE